MAEIGRVGALRREVGGVSPSVNPAAFGAGVASALGGMARELGGLARTASLQTEAQTSLNEAYRARQNKIGSARLQADLIRLDNEMGRELSERYDSLAPGAPGFTDETNAWAQTRYQEFLQNVPEDLRPEFEPTVERMLQEKTNMAFRLQVSSENAEFSNTVGNLQAQAQEELLTAPFEELEALEAQWTENLAMLVKNSPMDAQSTRDLAESVSIAISSAKMVRLAQEEALDNVSAGGAVPGQLKTEGQRVYSDRPVAAGLGRAAVGLLNAIAGPESGGEYNVMYSPDGRRYFSDFSAHPNQPATITYGPHAGKPSTAAGRYQFINGTWQEVKAELGLEDFSPENQDRGAWHLAQKDYRAATGRDLQAVLESGNQPAIIEAKRILTGTWEGLKNMSDEEFVNIVTAATGNPSSLLYDEEFSHIPLDQRFAIMEDGLAKAEAIRAQMAAEATAMRNAAIESTKQGLMNGSAGMQDIQRMREQFRLSVDEQEGLVNVFRQNQEQRYLSEKMLTSFEDPYFAFDPSNAEHKGMAGALFAQTKFQEAFVNGDEAYVDDFLLPMIGAQGTRGYIPTNVVGMLEAQMQSQNPQQATFALSTLSKLMAEAPQGFDAAVDDATMNQVAFFNAAQGSIPQEEILSYIRNQRDPMTAQSRQVTQEIFKTAMRDAPADFDPQQIARDMGAGDGIYMGAGQALFGEFYASYQYQLSLLGDHGKARDAALEVLGARYGITTVGGQERLMKHPPEAIYGPFNGGTDWIEQQLLQEFPGLAGQRYELISDSVTDQQKHNGQPPSYRVMVFDERGMPTKTLSVTDHVSGRGGDPYTPVRWYPQITPQMTQALVDQQTQALERQLKFDELEVAKEGATLEEARNLDRQQMELIEEREGLPIQNMGQTGVPLMSTPEVGMERGTPLRSAELPPTNALTTSPRPPARPPTNEQQVRQQVSPIQNGIQSVLGAAADKYSAGLNSSGTELFNTLQQLKAELRGVNSTPKRDELIRQINALQRSLF